MPPLALQGAGGLRVMGIDPGTRRVGYAVVQRDLPGRPRALAYGVIRTPPGDPIDRRLRRIHERLQALLARWAPASVAIESAFYGRSVSAALRIGEGRGAAIVAAAARGIPVASYAPAVVKKAVVGNGLAHKRQVLAMVQVLLGLGGTPIPLDASDALAIALCHLARAR
jgi:crossover junction endodeoxyribonuclease RuvC